MRSRADEDAIRALFQQYADTRDRRVRDDLVLRHRWLARKCAHRFAERGEPLPDLVQVAQIGVVKAVERFNPALGHHFTSFATPTVMGELRRHFRDTTWDVSVPRRSKELFTALNTTIETLGQHLQRPPRVAEVAEAMGLDVDTVLETMEASQCYRSSSLDQPAPGDAEAGPARQDRIGHDDPSLDRADLRVSTIEAIRGLDERRQSIVLWRFYEGCTQSEIGERLGIGQVQVSRLLRSALAHLRGQLTDIST